MRHRVLPGGFASRQQAVSHARNLQARPASVGMRFGVIEDHAQQSFAVAAFDVPGPEWPSRLADAKTVVFVTGSQA